MRREVRAATLTIAVVTILAIATTAFGAPRENRGKPDREPVAGTTCSSPWWEGDFKTETFTIVLDADNPSACVDVLTASAGTWYVTVQNVVGDGVRQLTIVPRDAVAPGDSCGGVSLRGDAIYEAPIPIPLPYPGDPRGFTEIPAATVNACLGNADPDSEYGGEFAELVEREDGPTTIEFSPTNEAHPLAFLVFSAGLKKTDVISIRVELP